MRLIVRMGIAALAAGCGGDLTADTVAFGDSVTFGYGGARGGWVTHLEQARGQAIANFGVPGEKVVNGKVRFASPFGPLALAPASERLLLLHGGNDVAEAFLDDPCGAACEPAVTSERFARITGFVEEVVDMAEQHGLDVTLATYWRVNPSVCEEKGGPRLDPDEARLANRHIDAYNARLIALAERRALPIVRLDELGLEEDPALFYDCIHPSDEGYRVVAAAWRDALPDIAAGDPLAGDRHRPD